MAISKVPSNIGSSAKQETGKAWMSEAAVEVRLNKRQFWMSELAGKAKEIVITYDKDNFQYQNNDITEKVFAAGGDYNSRVVVNVLKGVTLLGTTNASNRDIARNTFIFPTMILEIRNLVLNNYGRILGHGGRGSTPVGYDLDGNARSAYDGADAIQIYREGVTINNYGIIAGGGGGGDYNEYRHTGITGDTKFGPGGAPLGFGEPSASIDSPGESPYMAGLTGGAWGQYGKHNVGSTNNDVVAVNQYTKPGMAIFYHAPPTVNSYPGSQIFGLVTDDVSARP